MTARRSLSSRCALEWRSIIEKNQSQNQYVESGNIVSIQVVRFPPVPGLRFLFLLYFRAHVVRWLLPTRFYVRFANYSATLMTPSSIPESGDRALDRVVPHFADHDPRLPPAIIWLLYICC